MSPIRLGKKNQPFDFSEWDAMCKERLGYEIPWGSWPFLGNRALTLHEMKELGFTEAAGYKHGKNSKRHSRRDTEAC